MVIHVFQENTKRVWVGKNQGRSYIIIVYRVRQLANDNSIITYNAAHQKNNNTGTKQQYRIQLTHNIIDIL